MGKINNKNRISKMNRIDKILELIEKDGLVSKNRHRHLIDKRSYLYNALRQEGYSLLEIGDLFNKNHATIINGIKKHEFYTKVKDYSYDKNTEEYREKLELQIIPRRSLKDDVLRCTNTTELKRIQERIIMGKYE
jgi:IS30 family transposase